MSLIMTDIVLEQDQWGLHNIQEEPTIEDISRTPKIYAVLDGQQEDHQATMVEIEGKILNTSISILIDPDAFWSYASLKS